MSHYAVVDGASNIVAVWKVGPNSAQQLSGPLGAQQSTYPTLSPNPGETPFQAVQRVVRGLHGNGVNLEATLPPG